MRISEVLPESCVVSDLGGQTKDEVILEMVGILKAAGFVENAETVVKVIREREKLGSTGIGDGVAIPHGKMRGIDNILCAFGRSLRGIDFEAVDRKPAHIFFLLLAPEESASLHLKMLSRISKILRDPSFRKRLMALQDAHEVYANILEEDRRV
jgi:PTS system nitrogen regulatory IIA component